MLRIVAHEGAVRLRVQMSVAPHEGIILAVELCTQRGHPAFVAVPFLLVEQFTQGISDLNDGGQALPNPLVLDRQYVVIAFAKSGGCLEDDLPALRLDAQGIHFQRLEIRTTNEFRVARPDLGVERVFHLRHEAACRKHIQAFGYFLSQIRMSRIGHTTHSIKKPPRKGQSADDLPGVLHKVTVDCGRASAAVFEVVHFYGGCVHPIPAVQLFPGIFLEEHDIRRDIRQGVLAEGVFRQADSSQKIGVLRDMFPHRGIGGVHEVAADHERGYAAFPQQVDGFSKEVVVDGELPQFGKIRIVQRLVAEGRIPDYGVDATGTDQAVLEADVEMLLFGIEVSRNG